MDWDSCRALDTSSLGRLGEDWAVAFLKTRGFPILGRNLVLDPGEIDILARIDGERTVVEVRSTRARRDATWPPAQAFSAFDYQKAQQVRRVARFHRCRRVDVITVRFHERGFDLHWVPRAA
jgi:Holliday junction resolvase-like predicted endonuclease